MAWPRPVSNGMKTRIIIPTYNECENIVPLLNEVFRVMPENARVLVVDDGSPDGTADLVRAYALQDSRVFMIERPGKFGLASAYQAAFRHILDEGTDEVVITMDADFSHHPRYIPALVRASSEYDLVVGSRYVPGGTIERWELWRRMLSWFGNMYVRLITGLPTHDCTTGYSCMRADFLKKIPFERISAGGYAWWFSLRMMFFRLGAKITEIPITFTDRRLGNSKISTDIIYEGLIEPWRIRTLKI